MSDYFYSI